MEFNYGNFEANIRFLESQKIKWSGKKVLEIGCGNGSMTKYLFDHGADITAIDLSDKYLRTAKKRFGAQLSKVFKKMSGDKLEFPDSSFDIVVSFDLIEHIPDTLKHLSEVKRVLKPEGKYFFQTPNKVPSAIFAICRDKSFAYRENHPSLQTRAGLAKLVNRIDMKVEFMPVDYFTKWYRDKLPKFLRNINPQTFGLETNNFGVISNRFGKSILYIVTTPYFSPKGSSLRVDSILKKLSKDNDIDLLVYPVGEDTHYENVNIIRINNERNLNLGVSEISLKKLKLDLEILLKSLSLMKKSKYDLVHCEDFEAGFIGAILSLFFLKPKYVYDLHNTIVDNLRITNKPKLLITIFKLISKFVYSRYDMMIVNWKVYEKIGKKKTFLLYDESDIETKEVEIPTEKKYLAYSGNFKRYQGVEDFVRVYSKVNPSFDLVLVGNPTEEITTLVNDLKIYDKVHFTGVLDINKSNYVLSNAAFCLIPRISGDQPGLKMIHHVMLGKISLASDIPANKEILIDDYNSILYKNETDLIGILKDIDGGNIKEEDFKKGIEETQEKIAEIWSYQYFRTNYLKVFEDEK